MSTTLATHKVAAVLVGLGLVAALAFAFATPVKAQSVTDLQAQINSLLATIAALQAQMAGATGGTSGGAAAACFTFTRNHSQGDSGGEVQNIQKFLNSSADTQVSASGAGSPGNESSYFGPATKAAVVKFQNKYASEVLAPVGLSAGTGFWGAATRAKANAMCAGAPTGGTGTTPAPTGAGVWVGAAAQPANSLAPKGSARVPFTTFTITNNSGAAVTINGVVVERTGLAQDAVFSGIVLVDAGTSVQVGTSKTLNSNHQATIGDTFTMAAGETKTFTVAGNMASSLTAYAGQVVSLKVVAVNASGTVTGTLPIQGASHTANDTLTVGTVSTSTSSFDPGAAQSKNIGDTGVRVSGLRFTAGSAEDLKLMSVRWRQVGTASASDLANVVTIVDGTKYPTTISADGKYYTTVFPGGLLIAKGASIDVYNMVDLIGTNSASRTVDLEIDKVTDVYFVGQTYGYGIAPSGTFQPWFAGFTTTINPGTVTTIGKATEVPAQNIAPNVPNQVLGGFITDFKGEAVSVTSLPITIGTSTDLGGVITSISIVDANGAVVAGPVDQATTCTNNCTVTFTDTITFPASRQVYTIKGKLPSASPNNATVAVTTVPSNWGNPTGQVSGNTVTISTGSFTMNTMTIRAAALAVSLSTNPSSQNIVGGGQGILFANLQLDASQSGEDIRISAVPVRFDVTTMDVSELSSCQVFDGAAPLNTGGNVPTTAADNTATTFTFDNTKTIAKGTVLTLGVKCNVATSVSNDDNVIAKIASGDTWNATGVTSGSSVTETFGNLTGGTMTVGAGSVTLAVDASSPSYAVAAAGTQGVTLGVVKLRATNEALTLQKLGLTLATNAECGSASGSGGNCSANLLQVYIYDGATLVGTATFTGTATAATSTLSTPISLPRDTDKILTIKGDLANIGTSFSGGAGNLISVNPQGAETTGAASGTTIWSAGATTGVAGVRLFKSYPTIALDTLPSTGAADGRLMRFKVTANSAGPVGIAMFNFTVSTTSGVTVATGRLRGYTDSAYSQPISGQGSGGQIGSDQTAIPNGTVFELAPTTNPVAVPAGTTYYFELTASVSGMDSGDSIVTVLGGDASYSTPSTNVYNVATTSSGDLSATDANFIWSGNSTTTAAIGANATVDWSNGYGIPGLPSGGLIQSRSN